LVPYRAVVHVILLLLRVWLIVVIILWLVLRLIDLTLVFTLEVEVVGRIIIELLVSWIMDICVARLGLLLLLRVSICIWDWITVVIGIIYLLHELLIGHRDIVILKILLLDHLIESVNGFFQAFFIRVRLIWLWHFADILFCGSILSINLMLLFNCFNLIELFFMKIQNFTCQLSLFFIKHLKLIIYIFLYINITIPCSLCSR